MRYLATSTLLLCAFTLASCGHDTSSPTEPSVRSPATYTLAPGQSVSLGGSTVLTFDRISSDSRCPTSVTCVWAGEATASLSLRVGGDTQVFGLSTISPSVSLERIRFELKTVEPYPVTTTAIPQAEYRVTVFVSPG